MEVGPHELVLSISAPRGSETKGGVTFDAGGRPWLPLNCVGRVGGPESSNQTDSSARFECLAPVYPSLTVLASPKIATGYPGRIAGAHCSPPLCQSIGLRTHHVAVEIRWTAAGRDCLQRADSDRWPNGRNGQDSGRTTAGGKARSSAERRRSAYQCRRAYWAGARSSKNEPYRVNALKCP